MFENLVGQTRLDVTNHHRDDTTSNVAELHKATICLMQDLSNVYDVVKISNQTISCSRR